MADLSVLSTGGGRHFHSGQSPLYEASSCLGVESVHDLVFFSPRRPLKMHNWSSAFFLQERLEHRLSPSTLKAYVAAIAAHHIAVDGRSLGKHNLIVSFLRGARRSNPPSPPLAPSWDLSIVLAGLQRGPFELLDSVELKFLSARTALLTALTSIKRVGDL